MYVNQQFGRYTIVEIIGEGGMGTVGKALDADGKEYAIKQIRTQIMNHSDALARFEREKRIQSVLKHPNLLPLTDSGLNDDLPYFVMPYVEGVSLSQRLKRGSLKFRQGHVVVRDIGNALAFAHQQNILHRDIKPGNIILHPEGRAYLADFGIATDPTPNPSLRTATINIASMGTSDYMAPEVLRGQRATTQSEVYSFGVTIYEMLTGERYTSALYRYQDPWHMLPTDLAHVLERATHASIVARYPTIESFTAECLDILSRLSDSYRRRSALTTFAIPRRQVESEFFAVTDKETPQTASGFNPMQIVAGTTLAIVTIILLMTVLANGLSGQFANPNIPITDTALAQLTSEHLDAIETRNANRIAEETATAIAETALAQGITIGQQSVTETAIAEWQTQDASASETAFANPTAIPTSTLVPTSTVVPDAFDVGAILFTQRETTVKAVAGGSTPNDRTIPANTRVVVQLQPGDGLFEFAGYYHVSVSNSELSGWVDASDLAPNPPPPGINATATYLAINAPTSTITPTPINTLEPGVIGVGAILYSQRETTVKTAVSSSSPSDRPIPENTSVRISLHWTEDRFEFNGYYHVTVLSERISGWVAISDLALNPPPPITVSATVIEANESRSPHQGFATGQTVFINSADSAGVVYLQPGPVVTVLDITITSGTAVVIVSADPQYQLFDGGSGQWWWQIELGDGTRGYIEANYLSATPP